MRRNHTTLTVYVLLAILASLDCAWATAKDIDTGKASARAWSNLPDWSGSWSYEASPDVIRPAPRPGALPPGISLTPKYQALLAAAEAKYGMGGGRMAKCLPAGVPGVLAHGLPFEFVLTPKVVAIIFQNGEVRRIHTDGRPHLPPGDWYQNIEGDSIGHWEGDTLVIDTVGMTTDAELFVRSGLTVTKQTHVIERMRRKSADAFEIATTVIDPEIFTEPNKITRVFGYVPLGDFELGCADHMHETEDSIYLTPTTEGTP